MIKSIKLKLWLTLFIALVVSLGALLTLSYLSVKQRFLEYATDQILERLEPLEQALIEVYSDAGSLAPFVKNPNRWSQLRDTTYRQYLKDQSRRNFAPTTPKEQDWSEREAVERKLQPNQRAFFQHLILLDDRQRLVAGRPKEEANYVMRELAHGERTIAHIGYIKPKAFLRSVDKLFVDQQIKSLGILSVFMVFAALLVTVFVSRWLVTPLSTLAQSAKRVAAGDFSVRVDLQADDELGKLCQNFDDMTQSLEKNATMRKQWVADISHEMRTPLSVLKAQLEAMEDGIRPPTSENLELLRRNVDSLSGVVDDLYELSLADLGELRLHKSRVSMPQLLLSVLSEFEEKFRQRELSVSHEFDASADRMIAVDAKRIKQLFRNLLENCYRYTDIGGKIHIYMERVDGVLKTQVEDSAPSVSAAALSHIFDRLYRVEASRNRETGGAGLGLSICRSIAQTHGGRIYAGKSALGGLRQTLELPY